MNPQNHRASNQAIKQRKPHAESTAHLLFSSAVSQAMASNQEK